MLIRQRVGLMIRGLWKMEISEMQRQVDAFIQKCGGYWKPLSMMARLSEETGEVAREINVKYGEKRSKKEKTGKELEKELIDVIFTAVAMATSEGIDIERAFCEKMGIDDEKCRGVYFEDDAIKAAKQEVKGGD